VVSEIKRSPWLHLCFAVQRKHFLDIYHSVTRLSLRPYLMLHIFVEYRQWCGKDRVMQSLGSNILWPGKGYHKNRHVGIYGAIFRYVDTVP
jgi:hypothetical protein